MSEGKEALICSTFQVRAATALQVPHDHLKLVCYLLLTVKTNVHNTSLNAHSFHIVTGEELWLFILLQSPLFKWLNPFQTDISSPFPLRLAV